MKNRKIGYVISNQTEITVKIQNQIVVLKRIFIGLCITNTSLQANGKWQRGENFDCYVCEGTEACMNNLLAVASEGATLKPSEIK